MNRQSGTYSDLKKSNKAFEFTSLAKTFEVIQLTGVSGKKLIESQPIPGTWMLPGVLQVACSALRALRLGDLGP